MIETLSKSLPRCFVDKISVFSFFTFVFFFFVVFFLHLSKTPKNMLSMLNCFFFYIARSMLNYFFGQYEVGHTLGHTPLVGRATNKIIKSEDRTFRVPHTVHSR